MMTCVMVMSEHLEGLYSDLHVVQGYVVMKKPPLGGHSQVARGFGQK
jgi:hypothetical protein